MPTYQSRCIRRSVLNNNSIRWATPTTYAIVRPERKTAVKVFQDKAEVKAGQGQYPANAIEVRPGENTYCLNYYPFGKQILCPYVAGNREEGGRSRLRGSDHTDEMKSLYG